MSITKITSTGLQVVGAPDPKSKELKTKESEKEDNVTVSDEARALFEAGQARKLETIQEKIRSGFYKSREVTEKVVDGLIKDLTKTTKE